MEFDKWEEMRAWLKDGSEYESLPMDQRRAYQRAYDKMKEFEEIESRFRIESTETSDSDKEV